ncbi:DUF1211 domain-containing protein [Actinoplanes sp. TBRC 11911]|uniref:TMEM175 family protein n=1 Tax=Actinoplanes sp. TBRC 11911 TaxID=2729386 RepID=UPI00145EE335|nr:TMEM175 family protein [Actinoplanes sp. TBRC 11911]NMO54523.1 DUF1211 domain-containing protein [Actinoplanes sp. TBRC 11911]
MRTSRLEAFSDGVFAIIITIMVLELRVPAGHAFAELIHTSGVGLLTYLLSFVYVGIYWSNHHHLFHLVRRVNGGILWSNLALLFSLSLFPFTTAWVDESKLAPTPVAVYGINLLGAAVAYIVLQRVIIWSEGPDSPLRHAIGSDAKGKASVVLLAAGLLSALTIDRDGHLGSILGLAFFAALAILWIVPDRRIGRAIRENEPRLREPEPQPSEPAPQKAERREGDRQLS